jgi:ribosomal protein S12 methylthiotransferase
VTLGCPKNEADSGQLEDTLVAAGFSNAQPERADLVIINTCGFIDAAKEESIDAVLEACAAVHARGAAVAAIGCLVQRYRDELARALPDVDVLCGFEVDPLIGKLRELSGGERAPQAPVSRRRPLHTYIKVSDGCDRRCTFCAIPLIKGAYAITPPAELLELAERALARGSRELVLVGQDVSRYDAPKYGGLGRLLGDLAALGPAWIRLLYLQPDGLDDELLAAIGAHALPYLDVPLQHASPSVLRRMGRSGDGDTYLALLARVRAALPGVALRSTFITGFPGETETDFARLVDFVRAARLSVAGVFPFDPQEGTSAADFPDQLPVDVREQRAALLAQAIEESAYDYWAGLVGRRLDVLVERGCRGGRGEAVGRIAAQAPDVDGVTYVTGAGLRRGEIVTATIDGTVGFDLTARTD